MNVYQWVYSYSCWNRRKQPDETVSRGFGTFSWSEGLTLDEINELERRCSGYDIPYDLPSRPSSEEIETLFPVAFYEFTLASGKKVIARTRYVGMGFYDGRWGAILSHALILEEGDWPNYTFEYLDSPVFWKELPADIREKAVALKDEADREDPPYLPMLDSAEIPLSGTFSPVAVSTRLIDSNLTGALAVLLGNLFSIKPSDTLFVAAAPNEILWLFAGLTMLFPKNMANSLPMATYLSNRIAPEPDRERWYRVAGVEQKNAYLNLCSAQPEPENTARLNTLLEHRENFFDFLVEFHPVELNDIPLCVRAFAFLSGASAPEEAAISEFAFFFSERGSASIKERFLLHLKNGTALAQGFSAGLANGLFQAFGKDDSLRSLLESTILTHYTALKGDGVCIIKDLSLFKPELAALWLRDFAVTQTETNGLRLTLYALIATHEISQLESEKWNALFSTADSRVAWESILSEFAAVMPENWGVLLVKCPDAAAAARVLATHCTSEKHVVGITKQLIELKAYDWALHALSIFFADKGHAETDFMSIADKVILKEKPFAAQALGKLFQEARFKTVGSDSLTWYMGLLPFLPESERKPFLELLILRLPLPVSNSKKYLAGLTTLLDELIRSFPGIPPGRAQLFAWSLRVLMANQKERQELLPEVSTLLASFSSQPGSDREKLAETVLPVLCECAITPTAHCQVLMFLAMGLSPIRLAVDYVKRVKKETVGKKAGNYDERMIALILCCLRELEDAALREALLKEIAYTAFKKYTVKDLESFKTSLVQLQNLTPDETAKWDFFKNLVAANAQAGFFKRVCVRIGRIFRKG